MSEMVKVLMTVLLFGLVSLAGCQVTDSRSGFYSSPLQPGDEVVVLKPITVPPERARVYLQQGHLTSYGGSDQYTPFCYFLLRDPLPTAQVIEPGVLVVDSVWLNETTVSLDDPIRFAGFGIAFGGGGSRMPMAYQFHISLKADGRPNITLVCSGAFEMPIDARPIRLPQVREALGDYAQVRVPAEQTTR